MRPRSKITFSISVKFALFSFWYSIIDTGKNTFDQSSMNEKISKLTSRQVVSNYKCPSYGKAKRRHKYFQIFLNFQKKLIKNKNLRFITASFWGNLSLFVVLVSIWKVWKSGKIIYVVNFVPLEFFLFSTQTKCKLFIQEKCYTQS